MEHEPITAPRRSGRVFHKMRVQAHGRGHDGRKFREVCQTLVVNSHGGLLLLKNEVDQGEMIVLTNPDTDEEQECRVVFLGEPGDQGQRVGVEFLTPGRDFGGWSLLMARRRAAAAKRLLLSSFAGCQETALESELQP